MRFENGVVQIPSLELMDESRNTKKMKNIFLFLMFFALLFCSFVVYAENILELTARAIMEDNPDICKQAQELCYENDWEKSCIPKILNQFMCLRDYAIAKSEPSICDKVQGEEAGRLKRNDCYAQYARQKKDLESCEILQKSSTPDQVLYESCIYSIQRDMGRFAIGDCMKIKYSKRSDFIDCIAGLAKQENKSALCEEYFSGISNRDGLGETPLERCLKQVK